MQKEIQDILDLNRPLALKRRQLLLAGVSGAVMAMVFVATPGFAASPRLTYDFGSNYSVEDAYKIAQYTYVELGFKVNNRFFTTRLRSADGKVWRPV